MSASTEEMIDGVSIKIGRAVRVVPALNFKALRTLKPQLATLSSLKPGDQVSDDVYEAMIDIIHTALKRNYPNMSRDELEEDFDLANRDRIVKAVMGASGLEPTGEGRPAAR